MNLRILKKLSKRAAPLLAQLDNISWLGHSTEQFTAAKWESYTDQVGNDRKHWERGNARNPIDFHGYLYWAARNGLGHAYMHEPNHPRKGTVMLGWTSGYECPEWEEKTAWEMLERYVRNRFTDYVAVEVDDPDMPFGKSTDYQAVANRSFRNPSEIFAAVPALIAKYEADKASRQAEYAHLAKLAARRMAA